MQEIAIKPRAGIKFIYEGAEYICKKPTLGRASQLEDDLIEAKGKNSQVVEVMLNFLEEMGLPKSVTCDFEQDQIEQVIEGFKPKKKS